MEFVFPAVEIKQTPQYMQTVNAVSDYLKELPLPTEKNNTLVELMVKSHQQGAHDAFLQGFEMATRIFTEMKPEPTL